ncbi:MAG: response regulator [Acidimicrobiia bacterium]
MTPVRIMIVDDHPVLRQGLRFMLQHSPEVEVVEEASDGMEALRKLEESQPDVVLLDVKMPGLDGLATMERIHDGWPHLPVLILSMYDDPEYVEQALHSGASGYLLKTVAPDELVRAVRAAAQGAGYLQAEITKPVLHRFATLTPSDIEITLSTREREVLQLVADGMSTKQAAVALDLSESTVKTYLRQLFEKLGATHRAHAVALALRHRIIE